MMREKFFFKLPVAGVFMLAALVTMSPIVANANPLVVLKLAGDLMTKDAKGNDVATPVADAQVKPGETIRYTIVATNTGDQPALKLTPVGKIPIGTQYEGGTASAASALRVEYSLDTGKTWSVKPMITVHKPTGDVIVPAPPESYTSLRWIADKPLAPKAAVNYTYEVRVK